MTQFARPDADVLTTGWSATSGAHYTNIDEVTPTGTDVVQSGAVSSGATTKLRVSLSSVNDPGTTSNRTLSVTVLRSNANRTMTAWFALYENGVQVQTGAFPGTLLNTGFITTSVSITAPITDYSNLELELWGVASGGSSGTTAIRFDQAQFEIPNALAVRSASDTAGISDAVTRTRAGNAVASDTATLSDAAARAIGLAATAADSVAATDASARSTSESRATTDTMAVSDAATRGAQTFTRLAVDAAAVTDTVTRTTARGRTASDSVTVSDVGLSGGGSSRDATDALSISDTTTRDALTFTRATGDTSGITDASIRVLAVARGTGDTDSVADVTTSIAGWSCFSQDTVTITDTGTKTTAYDRELTDSVTVDDVVAFMADVAPLAAVGLIEPGMSPQQVTEGRHRPMQLVGG